ITANIVVGGDTVNTGVAGTYVVTYNVSDAAGNAATEVTRTVNVIPDTTAPVITLVGSSPVNLNVGDTYTDDGATANDNKDGDITANIVVGGDTVNTGVASTYIVTYNVSDAAGNAATEVTRTVIVEDVPTTVVLHEGYFESGWDGWSDGGNDCARRLDSRSYEGDYSIRIRDNSGTASSMTSPSFDLSPYNEVEFSFYFYAHSMENNEDFWLQYNDGSGFTTIKTWTGGVDFNNGSFSNKIIVTLNASQYNLVNNAQFRLRCDASGNNDQIFIDQVVIVGDGTSGSARGTTNKILSIPEDEVVVLEKNNFKLYPNPVKGAVLNIKLSSGNNNISYKIINMLGQVVNVGKTTKEVMVGNLEAGVYYIEVNNGKEKMTKRFVKSN
ncbi:immunoglobulin-like domain-containing protein, partial [Jejuia spongiicola]